MFGWESTHHRTRQHGTTSRRGLLQNRETGNGRQAITGTGRTLRTFSPLLPFCASEFMNHGITERRDTEGAKCPKCPKWRHQRCGKLIRHSPARHLEPRGIQRRASDRRSNPIVSLARPSLSADSGCTPGCTESNGHHVCLNIAIFCNGLRQQFSIAEVIQRHREHWQPSPRTASAESSEPIPSRHLDANHTKAQHA